MSGERFALAGEIVSTVPHAQKILRRAIVGRKWWLIPQARSVIRKLQDAGQAIAPTGDS